MKIEIELENVSSQKDKLHIKAEFDNQTDMYEFHRMYGKYFPRAKWLGLI